MGAVPRAFERRSETWMDFGFSTSNPDIEAAEGGFLVVRCLVDLGDRFEDTLAALFRKGVPSARRPSRSAAPWRTSWIWAHRATRRSRAALLGRVDDDPKAFFEVAPAAPSSSARPATPARPWRWQRRRCRAC
ncbi:hypothetical protein JL721_7567 [Aureococcus anophagefferens]|nr:hypothetical protein JL721_7567 [Aureococcus anophagefferens]